MEEIDGIGLLGATASNLLTIVHTNVIYSLPLEVRMQSIKTICWLFTNSVQGIRTNPLKIR